MICNFGSIQILYQMWTRKLLFPEIQLDYLHEIQLNNKIMKSKLVLTLVFVRADVNTLIIAAPISLNPQSIAKKSSASTVIFTSLLLTWDRQLGVRTER